MNPAPNSAVTPIADGGSGPFTWERSKATHYYRIRRGAQPVGSVSLDRDLPHHDRILDRFCQVLNQHEGDQHT